tara:strand:- start:540 stop:734 length:195 start_codon:yes stop_codon:yes gene_type:complete
MLTGEIKIWNKDKGWGFIAGDDGDDYFVNISNIRTGNMVKMGSRVKFDTAQTSRGAIAENVSLY